MEDSSQDKYNGKSDPQNPARQAVELLADTANQVLDAVSWIAGRLNSSGNVFKLEQAKGASAEVSLSIPAGGTGEIVIVLGETIKSYPARAKQPEQSFERGSKVRIVDVAVSTMFVEEFDAAEKNIDDCCK